MERDTIRELLTLLEQCANALAFCGAHGRDATCAHVMCEAQRAAHEALACYGPEYFTFDRRSSNFD